LPTNTFVDEFVAGPPVRTETTVIRTIAAATPTEINIFRDGRL
jgi:arginine/ornithine N-succinyltransferase beta subunit